MGVLVLLLVLRELASQLGLISSLLGQLVGLDGVTVLSEVEVHGQGAARRWCHCVPTLKACSRAYGFVEDQKHSFAFRWFALYVEGAQRGTAVI